MGQIAQYSYINLKSFHPLKPTPGGASIYFNQGSKNFSIDLSIALF
jgi:hypothetical protein